MSLISSYFLSDDVAAPIVDETLTIYRNFLNSFFYALKFRNLDAQAIELLILGFCAGRHLGKDEGKSTRWMLRVKLQFNFKKFPEKFLVPIAFEAFD